MKAALFIVVSLVLVFAACDSIPPGRDEVVAGVTQAESRLSDAEQAVKTLPPDQQEQFTPLLQALAASVDELKAAAESLNSESAKKAGEIAGKVAGLVPLPSPFDDIASLIAGGVAMFLVNAPKAKRTRAALTRSDAIWKQLVAGINHAKAADPVFRDALKRNEDKINRPIDGFAQRAINAERDPVLDPA